MKTTLIVLALLTVSSSFANAAQTINCKFSDATNPDKVTVTLSTDQAGSFAYIAGPSAQTTSSEGTLNLKRTTDTADNATFLTQVEVMQMSFKMPKAQVLRTGVSFKAMLTTSIADMNTTPPQDQALDCSAI